MIKSYDKFLPRFDDFMFFVTDSKVHQTLNFYLKSTKANRLAKVIRIGPFHLMSAPPLLRVREILGRGRGFLKSFLRG